MEEATLLAFEPTPSKLQRHVFKEKDISVLLFEGGDKIRRCDKCGKDKEVRGGKTCENGHFICSSCVSGGFFDPIRKTCPLCGTPLR